MQYIKLDETIKIYCPMMKASMQVSSEKVKQMNQLSKFILYVIKDGGDSDLIASITMLDKLVIEEELMYLKQEGLLESIEDGKYILSDLGIRYQRYISKIERFNDKDITVLVNKYSGEILKNQDLFTEKNKNYEQYCLPNKIVKILYHNPDPANSKDFLFSIGLFDDLIEQEKADIHTHIRFKNHNFYYEMEAINLPVRLEEDYCLTLHKTEEREIKKSDNLLIDRKRIWLERSYLKFKLKSSFPALNKYRKTIKQLENIYKDNKELLSDKALGLMKLFLREKKMNKETYFYLDQYTGEIFANLDENSKNVHPKKIMNLPVEYELNDIEDVDKNLLIRDNILCEKNINKEIGIDIVDIQVEYYDKIKKCYQVPVNLVIDYYFQKSQLPDEDNEDTQKE
ncbi:MAG: hypothetical protein ACOCRK_05030 [bacterium]